MMPIKQTLYLPVKVEDEFPKGECVMISQTDDMLVGYPVDVNGEIKADDSYQILGNITHWLKQQEAFVLTPEQLNEFVANVIKQTLENAAKAAEKSYKEDGVLLLTPIIGTFEETFKKFKV